MDSEDYRQLLNNEYNFKELNQEEFDDTLMHFAMLYHREQTQIKEIQVNDAEVVTCCLEKNELKLHIEHKDHYTVQLTNSRGDTFTYNPQKYQGLEDFLCGANNIKTKKY